MRNYQIAASQRGFSLISVLIWLVIIIFIVWHALKFVNAFYINSKVQTLFEGVAVNLHDESKVRNSLPKLLSLNYITSEDLPAQFFDELQVIQHEQGIEVSSYYEKTIWVFGPVEAVDAQGDYDPKALKGMDVLRYRAHIVLHFSPHAGAE
ncbi:MAG: hypothetical protein Q9M31_03290 [Mariprofundus sp.]|nr:hypothetical protein [Mariprofundus sp.]